MIFAFHVPPLVRWQEPELGKQRSDPDQKNGLAGFFPDHFLVWARPLFTQI